MATGILDNYNLRYNLGTAQLEMNTGSETWVGVPTNLVDLGLSDGKILVGNSSAIATAVTLSGAVTITNAGVASLAAASVTGALLTGYVSGAGTVASTDSILQGVNKLNGNAAGISTVANAALPKAGGTMTGGFVPWNRTTAQRDALFVAATGTYTVVDYTALAGKTVTVAGHVLTEGSDWTAAVANSDTATSLASAIDGLTEVSAAAVGAVVTVTATPAGTSGNSVTTTTNGSPNLTVQQATLSGGIQPIEGTTIYNTSTHKLNVFTTVWEAVTSA